MRKNRRLISTTLEGSTGNYYFPFFIINTNYNDFHNLDYVYKRYIKLLYEK